MNIKQSLFGSKIRIAATAAVTLIVVSAAAAGAILLPSSGGYDFALNQKISASSSLRLVFPEPMTHSSVEEFLELPSGLDTEREWEGETLILKPKTKLEAGKTYIVRLDARTLTAAGEPLGRELKYTFTVTGAPMVAANVPTTDAKGVGNDTDIVIVFDRPIVPVTQVQGSVAVDRWKDWPVTIEPKISGRWRWLGTTTASFVPDKVLPKATKFTVTVPPGIKTISGDLTEKDFSWSFETIRPRYLSIEPSEGSISAGPSTKITIRFSEEMDLASAKKGIHIGSRTDSNSSPKDIGVRTVTYGYDSDDEETRQIDKSVLIITPGTPLEFGKMITVTLDAGTVKGLEGNLGLENSTTINFSTVGKFGIIETFGEGNTVRIDFSSPVDAEQIQKYVSFSPAIDKESLSVSSYEVYDQRGTHRVFIYADLTPSTSYKITVAKEMQDLYGQTLGKPYEFSFMTPELQPAVFIHPNWKEFSIFERAKPPVYYFNQVNTSQLNIKMGSLSFDKFIEMRSARQGNYYGDGNFDINTTSEIREWTVKPTAKRNEWEAIPFDVQEKAGKLKPGLYAITVDAPEWKDYEGKPLKTSRIFSVTNLGVTLKYSGQKILVWVTDLQTGEPVKDADVSVVAFNKKGNVSGKTDASGFFEREIDINDFKFFSYDYQPQFFVRVQKDDDFSFVGSDWNNGFQAYDFNGVSLDFRSPERTKYRVQSYMYTDRPLYRAGDLVSFKGVVRFLDWSGKHTVPPGSRSMDVTITDAQGNQVYSKNIKISEFGSFSGSFQTSGEATLGWYGINASINPGTDADGGAYGGFQVLAYRKPEYRVEVTPDAQEYFNNQTINATIVGSYYFGAPMSAAPVMWRAYTTDYYFNKYTDGYYSFALDENWCWYNCSLNSGMLTSGEGNLDAGGKLPISFKANIDNKSVSQVLSIEADITDQNNQVVSNRAEVLLHKAKTYVGIRSDDWGVPAKSKAVIKLVTVNTDGTPAKNTPVELSLFSRTWNTIREKGVDGEYYYTSEPEDKFIQSWSARTSEEGKGETLVEIPDSGSYRVVATVKDADGRESKAGWSVYAWGDTYFNWPRTNNDRVDIVTDKPMYKVGETAKLIVKSPYQGKGVKALVTIEREDVISKKVIDVINNAQAIEVPITEDLVPTAYVSVVIMKPRIGETFNENGLDTGAPAFKVGYVKLPIDTSSKTLNVKITTNKERYLPAEKVEARIEAVDSKGNPVSGEFSLAVVDMSVLDLAGFSMPNLIESFYYERGLGVVTANMLTYLMERFKPGSKGGGGGDEDRTRGNFKDTAYWNPAIVTDKNGIANVSFTLPDNLTTWKLVALGSTKDHLFGGAEKDIIETKRVIVRPVRPRFAVAGDQVKLGVIVHNYMPEDHFFTVNLKGTGFTFESGSQQRVLVKKDGQTKVIFPIRISDATTASFTFSAEATGGKDVIEESIPIYRFGIMQTNATNGVTEDQAAEKVTVPTKKDAPEGTLTLSVAPSLAIYMPTSLSYLAEFPYGCAEQTMSALVPNAALTQLQGFEQFQIVDKGTLEKNVSAGLQTIYSFQKSNGGFGYWESGDKAYPYLTAYILYGFKQLQNAGYAVSSSSISRANSYLLEALRDGRDSDPVTNAYILYVMSEFNVNDAALLNAAYKGHETLPVYAKSHLAMALKKGKMDSKAETVLDEIISTARIDAREARFEEDTSRYYYYAMNTDSRTTALAVQAILRIDPENVLLPKVVRGMLSLRRDGHWDTTQSTAQAVISMVEYLKVTKELDFDYDLGVQIDGKDVLKKKFKQTLVSEEVSKALSELPRGEEIDVKVGKTGKGRLYYDLVLSYFYTPERIEPLDEGIGIIRETTPLTKADASGKVGTTHKVRLTITVPSTRNLVAVESMLPGGYEPIDLQYATSQQNLLGNEINQPSGNNYWDYYRDQTWRFTHIEYRDDRIFLFADQLPPGVYRYEYLVRATTPGRFRERPAKVWEMYNPETFGQTEGDWLTIGE